MNLLLLLLSGVISVRTPHTQWERSRIVSLAAPSARRSCYAIRIRNQTIYTRLAAVSHLCSLCLLRIASLLVLHLYVP